MYNGFAKWCSKTWTANIHSKSKVYLGDPSGNFQNKSLAKIDPRLVLEGDSPRLIDEWQEVPELWDAVRFEVDYRGKKGQFILAGSATPAQKGILHSGAGRISTLRMRPMSLYESKDSSGRLSLEDICHGKYKNIVVEEVNLDRIINLIIRGGWPGSLDIKKSEETMIAREYLNAIINHDIYRLEGINRNTRKMNLLLKSLARNESTAVSMNTLGFLFEALCERDLRIYAESFNANLFHYQDYDGDEIDSVVELENGDWVAIEIKLGSNQIDDAAKTLIKIKNKIFNDGGKAPKVLCIICGISKVAYLRDDGVYVVPITALKN